MAKVVNMQAKGSFSKDVVKAIKGAAEKGTKRLVKKVKKIFIHKRKLNKNLGGRSEHRINVPNKISKRMRRKRGF